MGVSPSFYFSELSKPILNRGLNATASQATILKNEPKELERLAPQFPLRGEEGGE